MDANGVFNDVWDQATHSLRGGGALGGTLTNKSGTITTGGTAQTLAAANTARRYLFIMNPASATEVLGINFTTAAVTTGQPSILLAPGDVFCMEGQFVTTELVSVIGATTGHSFVAKEG